MWYEFRGRLSKTPWLDHYPEGVPSRLTLPAEPVWWLLERTAQLHPDRVACYYYRRRLTYGRLLESARRVAALLPRLGVRPGDRVGVLLPNCPEYLMAVYGIWMAGGVAVSLSPLMVAEETSALLETTDCRTVISLDLLVPALCGGPWQPEEVLVVSLKEYMPWWEQWGYSLVRLKRTGRGQVYQRTTLRSFADETAQVDPTQRPTKTSTDVPAYLLPTGGTTGSPKAVVLSHRNLLANAWQISHWWGDRADGEKALAVLPFFHSYGLSTCVTAAIAAGASLILHHRFQPATVLKLIEQHRPTTFFAVPAMLVVLNEHLRRKRVDVSSLELCISGGAALEPKVAEEFARHTGAIVVEGYGLSEASPVTHVGPLDGTARPGTIGLPLPGTEARIVDAETGRKTLRAGEVGELIIRGPQVMTGYWDDPQETARVIRRGWLYTGDLAARDADGFFRIVDRKKDLIITSGMNVCPTDVEHVLRRFPSVADLAVVGIPDDLRGELVKAVVVLQKGCRFDRKAFDRFARRHLSREKIPRAVEVLRGDLPRNFLGKVLRRKLREDHRPPEVVVEETPAVVE